MNNEFVSGKNTKLLCDGIPLIQMIPQTLKDASEVDEIYVYCSNEQIKDYTISGVNYLKRDDKSDTDQADVNDMFRTFSLSVPADTYVLSHATATFLTSESINKAVRAVKTGGYDSAIVIRKMQEFLWHNGKAVNYDPLRIPRTQDLEPLYVETTRMYVFTKDVIQNRKSRIGENHICRLYP